MFIIAYTTLGNTEADQEARLNARLYPKPNIEVRSCSAIKTTKEYKANSAKF